MFFLFSSFILAHAGHFRCMHDVLFKDLQLQEENITFRQTLDTGKQPLRVFFDFSSLSSGRDLKQCQHIGEEIDNGYSKIKCTQADLLSTDKITVIKATLENLQQHLSELLTVNRKTSPSENYDVKIKVYIRSYGESDILAAATAIKYESTEGRPVAGEMYINSKEIPPNILSKDSPVRYFYDVLLHETIHVLGIANNLFYKWIDPVTKKRYTKMFAEYADPNYPGKTFKVFQTPNAIKVSQRRFARKYLAKDIPLGIELENLGGSGTAGSHVKGRTYYNEIMAGICLPPQRISEITLSLLEDTGWYEANWSMAEPLPWGDGKSFSDSEIPDFPITPPDQLPDNYICPHYRNKEYLCNYDYSGVSECGVPLYVPNCDKQKTSDEREICRAKKWYDSLGSHWFGPADTFDYMKILKAREWLMCSEQWSKTLVEESKNSMMTFGSDSVCSEIVLDTNSQFKKMAGCYRTTCLYNNTVTKMTLASGDEIYCTRKGEVKFIGNLSIICQDPKLVCKMRDFNKGTVVSPKDYVYTPTPIPSPTVFIPNNNSSPQSEDQEEDEVKNDGQTKYYIITIIVLSCIILILTIISVFLLIKCKAKPINDKDISNVLVPKPDGEKLDVEPEIQV